MQNIKVWRPDTREGFFTQSILLNRKELTQFNFFSGQPFGVNYPNIIIDCISEHLPPDYFYCGPIWLVSEFLMKILLEERKIDVEFFPITVKHKGEPIKDKRFFCMNILKTICCLDFTQSEYEFDYDDHEKLFLTVLYKLVLLPVDMETHSLFRLGEYFSIVCVISTLSEKIIKSGCTGVQFSVLGERLFRE
jgi:hypothetical protein